jgi:hypothetical protein
MISNSTLSTKNILCELASHPDSLQNMARLKVRSQALKKKRRTNMTSNRLCRFLAVTLLLAFALPAIAAPKNTKESAANIVAKGNFIVAAGKSLKGTDLPPGEYKVLASDSQVSFIFNGKIAAQAPIQWKDADPMDTDAVIDEGGRIRELRFKGKKQSAVIM